MKKNNNNYSEVLKNIKEDGANIQFASQILRDNKIIAEFAIKTYPEAVQYISERLRNFENLFLAAVKKNGLVLEFASDKIKNNSSVVFAAVSNTHQAFRFASLELQEEPRIALEAIKQDPRIFKNLSKNLQNNKDFCLTIIEKKVDTFQYFPENFLDNFDFAKKAITKSYSSYQHISERLKKHHNLALSAFIGSSEALNIIHEDLFADLNFVNKLQNTCLKTGKDSSYLGFISDNIKNNIQFRNQTLEKNPNACIHFNHTFNNSLEDLQLLKNIYSKIDKPIIYSLPDFLEEMTDERETSKVIDVVNSLINKLLLNNTLKDSQSHKKIKL